MIKRLKFFLPGENTRMVFIAAFIGIMAGLANIVFRTVTDFVHEQIFVRGWELFHLSEGGLHLLLLPMIPISGMVLLIPLSLLFPGQVNGTPLQLQQPDI